MAGRTSKEWLPLANDAESIHTATMSLKNAALLALIGTILLTVLVLAHFISTVLGVMRDVVPAMALLTSLVHLFASLSVVCSFTSSTESNPDTRRVPHQAAAAVLTDDPRRGLVFRQNCTSPDVGDVPRQSPEAMGLDGFPSGCRR